MPISTSDAEEMLTRVAANGPIADGDYIVVIEDVNVKQISDGRRPIQWELTLPDRSHPLEHLHWIDKPGGVEMLIRDLWNVGIIYHDTVLQHQLNSLIGATIKIRVKT